MSTFFLQRGIRLPVPLPANLQIKDIDVHKVAELESPKDSNGRFAADFKVLATQKLPTRLTLDERISQFVEEKGQKVVIRLADEDPFSPTQRAVTESLKNDPAQVKNALSLLTEMTGVKNVIFAINKGQDIGKLGTLAEQLLRIHVRHYPMMTAPCLAREVLDTPPILTTEVRVKGVLVVNIGELMTLLPANEHVVLSVITPNETTTVRVQRNSTVKQLLESMGLSGQFKKVVIGSPLLGDAYHNTNIPIVSDAITLFPDNGDFLFENVPCCNCGKCVKVCPSRLLPGLLSKHIYAENFDIAMDLNVHSCIECGCCAYMCPSRRSLVQFMKLGKQESLKQ